MVFFFMHLYFNQQLAVTLVKHQLAAMFYRLSHYIIKETVGPQKTQAALGQPQTLCCQ